MAEQLNEVLAKMKALRQQNSQTSNKAVEKPVEIKKEVTEVTDVTDNSTEEDNELAELEDEMPEKVEKASVSEPNKVSDEERKAEIIAVQETEILQNNGVFRREILAQLQELNKALVAIASILVDHGKN